MERIFVDCLLFACVDILFIFEFPLELHDLVPQFFVVILAHFGLPFDVVGLLVFSSNFTFEQPNIVISLQSIFILAYLGFQLAFFVS